MSILLTTFCFVLREILTMYARPALNSQSCCLSLQSAETRSRHHYIQNSWQYWFDFLIIFFNQHGYSKRQYYDPWGKFPCHWATSTDWLACVQQTWLSLEVLLENPKASGPQGDTWVELMPAQIAEHVLARWLLLGALPSLKGRKLLVWSQELQPWASRNKLP